jgi:uncharacterized membrane protein YdjX (TVP38/TMEM64 family)
MEPEGQSVVSSILWGVALGIVVLVALWVALGGTNGGKVWRTVIAQSDADAMLVGAVFAVYLVRPVTGVPPSAISFLVGVKFGIVVGLPVVVVGTALTGLPAYYFGCKSRELPRWIPGVHRLGDASERFVDRVGVYRGMLAASVSPTPLDPVAYAAGLADVSWSVFLVATLISAVPWAGAYCYGGAVAGDLAIGPGGPPTVVVALGVVIACLLLAGPVLETLRNRLDGT